MKCPECGKQVFVFDSITIIVVVSMICTAAILIAEAFAK